MVGGAAVGGGAGQLLNVGGMAGGLGMRIEGDTKDVSASQNTNNAHNM